MNIFLPSCALKLKTQLLTKSIQNSEIVMGAKIQFVSSVVAVFFHPKLLKSVEEAVTRQSVISSSSRNNKIFPL